MFQWILTFLSVYETRSFTKSAELLFVSQPTVSMQIKKLEQELGSQLFVRRGNNALSPTKSADYLYPKLLHIKEEWRDAANKIANQENFRETCTIACSNTSATHLIPKVMQELLTQFPQCDFRLEMMNSHEVIQSLEQHKAQIGITENRETNPSLERNFLLEDELVLAGDPDSEFWLLREEHSGLHYFNMLYLKKNDLSPRIISVNNNDVITQLLSENVGKTIISKLSLLPGIPYFPIDEPNKREFYLFHRKNLEHPLFLEIATAIHQFFKHNKEQDH